MPKNIKLVIPTYDQLCLLPREVLWLEVAELAAHSVPLVAQRAEAILADRSVPPTAQEVHELWQQHQSQMGASENKGRAVEAAIELLQ